MGTTKTWFALFGWITIAGCATCQAQNGRQDTSIWILDALPGTIPLRIINGNFLKYPCYAVVDNRPLGNVTIGECEPLATAYTEKLRRETEARAAQQAEAQRVAQARPAATRADSAKAEHPRIHVGSGPAKEIPDWTHPIYARSGVPGCFEESDLETMMALMRDGQFNAASKVAGCLVLPAGERATVLKRDGWIDVYFKVAISAAGSSPMIVWASAYGFQNADDPGPFKPTIQQAEQK